MTGGIEAYSDGTIVAHGPEGVRVYDILAMRSALRLEITTGVVVRHGYSLVQASIKRGYVPVGTRTKKAAYKALNALAVSIGAPDHPLGG